MTESVAGRTNGAHRKMLAPRPPVSESAPGFPLAIQRGEDRNHIETTSRRRSAKPRLVACQSCRHAKLRCEDSAGGTRPCQRCRELSRPCRVDTSYKRVNKKTAPFDQLKYQAEQQQHAEPLDLLPIELGAANDSEQRDQRGSIDIQPATTQIQGTTTNHPPSSPRQSSGSPDNRVFKDSGRRATAGLEQESSQKYRQYHYTAQNVRSIDMVTVDPVQIQHFFSVYFSHYHPSLPIVKPIYSADSIYDMSPLLFWSIVMTAARHDQTDFSLLQSLSPAVRSLLWSTIANPPHILPSLQAMCILCAWPFAASSMTQDITYIIGGILKTAALQAGLYQPDVYAHFSRSSYSLSPDELCEAARVWCCIYVTIESLAITAGHLPYIAADRTIEQASTASNPYNLPTTLHQAIIVQMFRNKVHSAMGDLDRLGATASRPKRASSLKLLEVDFQELERRLGPSRSHRVNIDLLSAAFQLRGYWLLEPQESSCRRDGIIRAYDNVIDLASEIESADKSDLALRYSPWSTYMMCVVGAFYISKVVHSAYRPYIDVDRGKHAFNTCLLVLRQCSVEDNDIPGRSSRLVAQLWNIHQGQAGDIQRPPTLKIASRLFYSIAYDSICLWREKYGGHPANGAPSLPPPFIPASPSVSPNSALPSQSPPTSTTHSKPGNNPVNLPSHMPRAVGSSLSLNGFIPDLHINPPGELTTAVNEDFNSLWDIGFLNPNATNFNQPLPDFNLAPAESSWL